MVEHNGEDMGIDVQSSYIYRNPIVQKNEMFGALIFGTVRFKRRVLNILFKH